MGATDTIERLADRGFDGRLAVRVHPKVGAGHSEDVATGADAKFGIPYERAVDALRDAQPAYLGEDLGRVLPSGTGEALVVDDRTESAHVVRVRERRTPHGGDSPTASGIEANRARTARRRNG